MKANISIVVIINLFIFTILLGYPNLETENTAIAEWLPEQVISVDVAGTEHQILPSIAVEDDKVYVVWQMLDVFQSAIQYRYFDGISWQSMQNISDSYYDGFYPRIAVDNGTVHLVWVNPWDELNNVTYRKFDGSSWCPTETISRGEIGIRSDIAADNGKVYIVWSNRTSGNSDIYIRHFNGTYWQPEEIISNDTGKVKIWQGCPLIAMENEKLHAVWRENDGGAGSRSDIIYRYFNGTAWQPEETIDIDVSPTIAKIAVEDSEVHVVWGNDSDGDEDIYYKHFNGTVWEPKLEISSDITNERQYAPDIAAANGKVHVIWVVQEAGPNELHYRYFNGTSWQLEEKIGFSYSNPSIAAENYDVHVVWNDDGDGDWDIFYRHFAPPDLEVTSSDILFNPPSPVKNGTSVTISATIHNIGLGNASNVLVRFYDGEPGDPPGTGPGIKMDSDQTLLSIPAGESRTTQVPWTASPLGVHNIYVVVDPENNITESNETNNIASKAIEVRDILPPTLYIEAIGEDIILNWTPPNMTGISHYLLYRAASQTGFDFNTVWKNTLSDNESGEPGPIPLRTTWNDTGAASGGASQEYYYTIRTVTNSGETSFTSRTIGKWTKTFSQGVSTFSIPLEPLETRTTDYYLTDMNATYIKWMNTTTHTWMRHDRGSSENITLIEVGEGYEIGFLGKSIQTKYTFTGMPGAMVMYDDNSVFLGFDPDSEARNLTVSIEPDGNVTLTWEEPASMGPGDWYEVYYSNTRDGFFGTLGIHYDLACPAVNHGTNTTNITGLGANAPGARLYFMVVPFNSLGVKGASTYSIGIWTEEYLAEYDTFGIPLKMSIDNTVDWYCDNIPDAVGINYYNISAQRWSWHSTRMPKGAFDPLLVMTEGYQISTSNATKYTFIGR